MNEKKFSINSLGKPLILLSLPFTLLFFMLPIYSKELGASAIEIGGLISVFTITTMIIRPIVGWATDRFGRRPFLVTGFLFYTIAMGTFVFASSIPILYIARFVQGIGSSFVWISLYTIIADITEPEKRGGAMGRLNEFVSRGALIGVFVGFTVLVLVPGFAAWQIIFSGYFVFISVGGYLAWKNIPETKPTYAEPKITIKISNQLLFLLIIIFFSYLSEAMLSPIYLIFLQDKFSVGIGTLALAFLPAGIISAFFSARLGRLSDRFGRINMIVIGFIGAGVVSFFLPSLTSILMLTIFYTLLSVIRRISGPAETALVAQITGIEHRGTGFGYYELSKSLGVAIGPLVGGILYETVSPEAPFIINALALFVISIVISLGWKKVKIEKTIVKTLDLTN